MFANSLRIRYFVSPFSRSRTSPHPPSSHFHFLYSSATKTPALHSIRESTSTTKTTCARNFVLQYKIRPPEPMSSSTKATSSCCCLELTQRSCVEETALPSLCVCVFGLQRLLSTTKLAIVTLSTSVSVKEHPFKLISKFPADYWESSFRNFAFHFGVLEANALRGISRWVSVINPWTLGTLYSCFC